MLSPHYITLSHRKTFLHNIAMNFYFRVTPKFFIIIGRKRRNFFNHVEFYNERHILYSRGVYSLLIGVGL